MNSIAVLENWHVCEYDFCNDIHVRFPLSLFQYFLARPFLLDPFFIHESFFGVLVIISMLTVSITEYIDREQAVKTSIICQGLIACPN